MDARALDEGDLAQVEHHPSGIQLTSVSGSQTTRQDGSGPQRDEDREYGERSSGGRCAMRSCSSQQTPAPPRSLAASRYVHRMSWQWPAGAACGFLIVLITTPAGVSGVFLAGATPAAAGAIIGSAIPLGEPSYRAALHAAGGAYEMTGADGR
jgi:hypothetical protein